MILLHPGSLALFVIRHPQVLYDSSDVFNGDVFEWIFFFFGLLIRWLLLLFLLGAIFFILFTLLLLFFLDLLFFLELFFCFLWLFLLLGVPRFDFFHALDGLVDENQHFL